MFIVEQWSFECLNEFSLRIKIDFFGCYGTCEVVLLDKLVYQGWFARKFDALWGF